MRSPGPRKTTYRALRSLLREARAARVNATIICKWSLLPEQHDVIRRSRGARVGAISHLRGASSRRLGSPRRPRAAPGWTLKPLRLGPRDVRVGAPLTSLLGSRPTGAPQVRVLVAPPAGRAELNRFRSGLRLVAPRESWRVRARWLSCGQAGVEPRLQAPKARSPIGQLLGGRVMRPRRRGGTCDRRREAELWRALRRTRLRLPWPLQGRSGPRPSGAIATREGERERAIAGSGSWIQAERSQRAFLSNKRGGYTPVKPTHNGCGRGVEAVGPTCVDHVEMSKGRMLNLGRQQRAPENE